MHASIIPAAVALLLVAAAARAELPQATIDAAARDLNAQVIAWRRDIHQHPELGNREFRTAKLVAAQLQSLGLEVRTGIAHTGVAAVLKGGRPGPTVALRADMDALPVTEQTGLPFRSTATGEYRGEKVGVMHACGHDAHVAILLGVAEILSRHRAELPGTVLFVFQPAEEGSPPGEEGGAKLMLKEGLFSSAKPDAVFGVHVHATQNVGAIAYRSGPAMAASDLWTMRVRGRQTHGARPWTGVDPIVASAQIVLGLQTIVSRQIDSTAAPAILSVGIIDGGVRNNIIPDEVYLEGTLRTFDEAMRDDIAARMKRTAEQTAAASGATAEVAVQPFYPVLINDPGLTSWAAPLLSRALPDVKLREVAPHTASEDFAYYAREAPGFFFWVGVTPAGQDPDTAAMNHSPHFQVDEGGLLVGTRALATLAVRFLER